MLNYNPLPRKSHMACPVTRGARKRTFPMKMKQIQVSTVSLPKSGFYFSKDLIIRP